MHQLISLIWLHLQVVLGHGSRNYSRRLVLIGQLFAGRTENKNTFEHARKRALPEHPSGVRIYQYALVEVAVAVLQADSYDAGVLGLRVVSWGLTGRAGSHGCEGDRPPVRAGRPVMRGRDGSRGDAGCGGASVHGVEGCVRGGF